MVVSTAALDIVMTKPIHLISQTVALVLKVRNQLAKTNPFSYNYINMHVIRVVSPVVEWDLPKAVGLHGAPIHGSCSVTAYPRPAVRVITPHGCDSQKKNVHIGRHTNKVEFTINNATKRCEKIHCFIQTFGEVNTTGLLIIGKHQA